MEYINQSTNENFRQTIILNDEVEFIASNDILFSTKKLDGIPVQRWFPMIESIYESLRDLTVEDGEIQFSRVESPAEFLPGSYDFSFVKIVVEGREVVQWNIYDYTNVYTYLTKYQQLKNEKDIYRQKLEYKDKQVKLFRDLI